MASERSHNHAMPSHPALYDSILVFGGGTPAVDGPPVATVGGWLAQPNLALSYLLAARQVIEAGQRDQRSNEVALPVAYLQRHALEVAIKHVLGVVFGIKASEDWLEALRQDPNADAENAKEVPFTHDFKELLSELKRWLAAINFGDPPQEVVDAAYRLGAAEQFEPTRFRYLTKRGGARSFPTEIVLPIGETQALLEELFKNVFEYRETHSDEENLVTSLTHYWMGLDEQIQRIVPLDRL